MASMPTRAVFVDMLSIILVQYIVTPKYLFIFYESFSALNSLAVIILKKYSFFDAYILFNYHLYSTADL